MIVLDTHVWIWWVHNDPLLPSDLELSPEIAIDSTQLPPPFHKDPADQMIVATARIHNVPLVTCDHKIRAYPHVQLLP